MVKIVSPWLTLVASFLETPHGVSQENSQLLKKLLTGMNLRDLNVLLLHYPFMSNLRYCLGCATKNNRECALHNYSDRWRLRSRLPVH